MPVLQPQLRTRKKNKPAPCIRALGKAYCHGSWRRKFQQIGEQWHILQKCKGMQAKSQLLDYGTEDQWSLSRVHVKVKYQESF